MDTSKCAECPLYQSGDSDPLDITGNPDGRFVVVTDKPTEAAARAGKLLSSSSMQVLASGLNDAGFSRDDFLFIPQVRCAYDSDTLPTKTKTLIQKVCRQHLVADIHRFKPEAVIPLGAEAAKQTLGRAVKITKVRGVSAYSEEFDAHVLPLLNPGQVVMYPQHAGVFKADCVSLRRLVDSGYDEESAAESMLGDYKIVHDLQFLIDKKPKLVFFDTENTGLQWFYKGKHDVRDYDPSKHGKDFDPSAAILTMQFCVEPGVAYLLPWDHPEDPRSLREKRKLKRQIEELMCHKRVRVVGQNLKYDTTYLYAQTGIRLKIGGDTNMLAALVDENMINKDQATLVKMYVPEMAGYCVAPDTRLWMSDLTWRRAGDVVSGDTLVGFDEHGDSRRRCLRKSSVLSTQRLNLVCYEVVMSSGTKVVVSSNHQWLVNGGASAGNLKWVRTDDPYIVGKRIKRITEVVPPATDFMSGWMSGLLDGEGWTTKRSEANSFRLGFAQKAGSVLDRALSIVGSEFSLHATTGSRSCHNVTCRGSYGSLLMLQKYRPIRLLEKGHWWGCSLPQEYEWDYVVSVNYLGIREVVSIKTSTSTFVAEGLASHNSDAFDSSVDKSRMWEQPLNRLLGYGCGDADSGYRLYQELIGMVKEDDKLLQHYRRVSLPGLNMFASMELRGVPIDEKALDEFEKIMAVSVAEQEANLLAQVPNSIKKLHIDKGAKKGESGCKFSRAAFTLDVLFYHKDGFRLKPKVFTESTRKLDKSMQVPSTSSKDHLPFFFDTCPFTVELAQYIKDERLLNTSIRGFKKKYIRDGLVRPTYSLSKAVTGRSASSEPNGQNYPTRGKNAKAYKRTMKAPEGRYVLAADLSQAELRISADMANERTMIDIYRKGGDVHKTTAATVAGIDPEKFMAHMKSTDLLIDVANEWPGSGAYLRSLSPGERRKVTIKDFLALKRFQAKAVNFGYIYGMWWKKFSAYAKTQYGAEFTDEESKAAREAYFARYSGLEPWHERMKAFAREHGYVRSYSGRIRHLPAVFSEEDYIRQEAERQAVNSPVQEFASSWGVMAGGRMNEEIDPEYLAPIAFIHDAIYTLVPYEYLEWGAKTLKWYLESNPVEEWFGLKLKVPIVADVSFDHSFVGEYEMDGLEFDKPYDFSRFWDESSGTGILVPKQKIPPNNGRLVRPVYTGF